MHYKNSGLRLSFSTVMSMWVHNSFKRVISSSNFVAIALLVVLARNAPGTTSPFSSLLDPVTFFFLFSWRALRNVNIRKESSRGSPGREESLLIWILKKCCWNGSTNDALMVFVYQGKWSEAKQGFSTRRNTRKWNFLQHSRQALGGCRSSWPDMSYAYGARQRNPNRIPKN